MVLLVLILVVLALGMVSAVLVARWGVPGVEEPVSTQSFHGLGEGPVTGSEVAEITLDLAFRGYRMDQVDDVLCRLSQELADKDAQIERLRKESEHGDF